MTTVRSSRACGRPVRALVVCCLPLACFYAMTGVVWALLAPAGAHSGPCSQTATPMPAAGLHAAGTGEPTAPGVGHHAAGQAGSGDHGCGAPCLNHGGPCSLAAAHTGPVLDLAAPAATSDAAPATGSGRGAIRGAPPLIRAPDLHVLCVSRL